MDDLFADVLPFDGLLYQLAVFNYDAIIWLGQYLWVVLTWSFFIAALIGLTPLSVVYEDNFSRVLLVYIRRVVLFCTGACVAASLLLTGAYVLLMQQWVDEPGKAMLDWFYQGFWSHWAGLLLLPLPALLIRGAYLRYGAPFISAVFHKVFFRGQTEEVLSDIRDEFEKYEAKDFIPSGYYTEGKIFLGLDKADQPIYVPEEVWLETNMQIVGPTRYGKGVVLGCLLDQAIRRGEGVFYIDPKNDRFAPHIMYQSCKAMGRRFYYITLHDKGIGRWAPFKGGDLRDGIVRMQAAFDLEFKGDPGTDYYKSQERKEVEAAFRRTRDIDGLHVLMMQTESNRVIASLEEWRQVRSLCPQEGKGFSISQALQENAVVYVQGGIGDSVVKTASKLFIIELIQEAMRLDKERTAHLSLFVDEVRFLVSRQLADALATAVGFRVNIVTAYQSISDLMNPDDTSLNGESLSHSMNVNSQLKLVYGGADFETAEWASALSGGVQKHITRSQKASITSGGGEVWGGDRMVGLGEENLIPENVILSLPPRVCMVVQPRQLAQIGFTCFVPVDDAETLNGVLRKQKPVGETDRLEEFEPEEAEHELPAVELESEAVDVDVPVDSAPAEPEDEVPQAAETLPAN